MEHYAAKRGEVHLSRCAMERRSMKDGFQEIVCVDSWFERLIAVVFLALLGVIVYAFSVNMRTIIKSD